MPTFVASNNKAMEMNNHVLNVNSSSATARFWPQLKRLSNRDKLNLIALLSNSMTQMEEEEPTANKGWASRFAGKWQDNRSAEEIIADIRAARTENMFKTEL